MSSIFEYGIGYVEDLSAFNAVAGPARAAGLKGLAVKLQDSNGNPFCESNAAWLEARASELRGQGFSLGVWSCPRSTPVAAAKAVSALYKRFSLSFCVFETEWEYKTDGGMVDVATLVAAWRKLRPKAYTGFATTGEPPTTFNHAAVIADRHSFLCPENYWLQSSAYDVRRSLAQADRLGWPPERVKPTLTGVEGHDLSEALVRMYRAGRGCGHGWNLGYLLWRADMLTPAQYEALGVADTLALR